MTDNLNPQQFHDADGVEDWRVLGEGAFAFFPTASLAESARLVTAIGGIDGVEAHPPATSGARVAAALAAGGRLVRDDFAPSWWTLADAAGNEADIATVKGRD